ncbi:MAG TPA: phosphatase PAP2 family protein [Thermoanaerobaculia bacterium]|nr:phosphatase PAP2 family protein [Thermoanaerobaculia bacterium]
MFFALTWAVVWSLLLPMGAFVRAIRTRVPGVLARPAASRLIQRHGARFESLRVYAPSLAILLAGIAATLFIGENFVELAVRMRANSPAVLNIDQRAFSLASGLRSSSSTLFFTAFTIAGSPVGLGVIAVAAALFVGRRHRGLAMYIVATAAAGGLLEMGLKMMFARTRPNLETALRAAHGYSFPSGHAMGSTIVCGALAYVVARSSRPWRFRSLSIAFLVSAVLAIGMSRVYLGVHWLSDIAAGVAAGLVWLIVATVTFEMIGRLYRIRRQRSR